MTKRNLGGVVCGLIALAATAAVAQTMMSVQVQSGQLRATPSFLGTVVGSVAYGEQVQVVQTQGPWMKVSASGARSGWLHASALTKKRIAMQAGARDAQTAASGDELALAGKGFNSDVEAEFRSQNRGADFAAVDRMERIRVTPAESKEFLRAGGVAPAGGRP